ncbi:MAG: cyclic nucleotide-binding domain-containing protein [Myxococcales bacterium]|nr:cyclic nucleotide-binding domain-containing protein [Myxococcota bacterium]MDW8280339.1 cyclic nucleotide-binding domain-containing protein [Myxococcales bacterium]
MSGEQQAITASLSRMSFFGGLEEVALGRIAGMLRERRLDRGEVLFREGEFGRSMYIIQSGTVVMTRAGDSGLNVRMVRLGPGDFFGEMALIEVQPRSMTVTAETPAVLLELTNMDLLRLYQEDLPAYAMIMQNISRELCRRLRRADIRIVEFADEMGDEVTQIRPAGDLAKVLDPKATG